MYVCICMFVYAYSETCDGHKSVIQQIFLCIYVYIYICFVVNKNVRYQAQIRFLTLRLTRPSLTQTEFA